jgi:hypothetical protein
VPSWDVDPRLSQLFDNISGAGVYYMLERHFWIEMWRAPIAEAVDDHAIELRHYGPVLAFAYPREPQISLFNLLLGADRPGAVVQGQLKDALDWTESLGLAVRVPVRGAGEFGEPEEAADYLKHRGYSPTATSALFARPTGPPGFAAPAGIEVEAMQGESKIETFCNLLSPSYGLEWMGEGFIIGLPGRPDWRTYIAADESGPIAAAAMFMHYDSPQLGFAATVPGCRRRGGHTALLHRQIEDAGAAGASQVFAFTDETLGFPEAISPGARNLIRAGFHPVDSRSVWRPPEELIGPWDDEDDEDEDDDWGRGGDDGPDEPDDGDRGPAARRELVLQG